MIKNIQMNFYDSKISYNKNLLIHSTYGGKFLKREEEQKEKISFI